MCCVHNVLHEFHVCTLCIRECKVLSTGLACDVAFSMSHVHAQLATVAVDGVHTLHATHAGDIKKVLKAMKLC